MLPRSPLAGRASGALVALVAALLLAAPVAAQTPPAAEREAAVEALEHVEALAEGTGVRTGRELTPALAELAASRSDLGRADRKQAGALLARPTDDPDPTAPPGLQPYRSPTTSSCTTHFCVHWVENTVDNDAPNLFDGPDSCLTPDYIDLVKTTFEQSFAVENAGLGWRAPVSDGDGKTDVYVKDVGDEGIFGYAATDPGQSGRSRFAFQVMDDDYAADEFPKYGGEPTRPLQVTAAHEYNHVLQYGYDTLQDAWMFESTATWAEDKVFDAVDDYHSYLTPWAQRPSQPLTDAGDGLSPSADDLKMYGSAVWNHWLDGKHGTGVVRRAWETSVANSVEGGGFAPGAYDAAIREAGGPGFAADFADFAASTAEWGAANSGIHEGGAFPAVARAGSLTLGAAPTTRPVDHSAFELFSVPASGAARLELTGTLPSGTSGGFALVGLAGGTMTKAMELVPNGGQTTVTLPDPGRFSRITAVVVNADTSHNGFEPAADDWSWRQDDARATVAVVAGTGTSAESSVVAQAGASPTGGQAAPIAPTDCGAPAPAPSPPVTPSPAPTPSPTPTPKATAASLKLGYGKLPRLRRIARRGYVSIRALVNKAGRLTARATVDRATARRLRVGRRATRIGTARRTAPRAGRFTVNVRLTRRARAGIKRQRRALRVKVRTRFVPAGGGSAVTRTVTLRLRP